MTTLSKLQQEGREEFGKNLIWDCKKNIDSTLCTIDLKEAKTFLTTQIEKAYLAALSDVEKGLPSKHIKLEEYDKTSKLLSTGHNEALSKVKEVINSLREK